MTSQQVVRLESRTTREVPNPDSIAIADTDAQRAYIRAKAPSIDLDGKAPSFVRGVFVEVFKADRAGTLLATRGSRTDTKSRDVVGDAQRAMVMRARNAWRGDQEPKDEDDDDDDDDDDGENEDGVKAAQDAMLKRQKDAWKTKRGDLPNPPHAGPGASARKNTGDGVADQAQQAMVAKQADAWRTKR